MDSHEKSSSNETKAIVIHHQIQDCQEESKDANSCQESEENVNFQEKDVDGCYQKVHVKEDENWHRC